VPFQSLMFLSAPAPLPRRIHGHDYTGLRGGYGPRFARVVRPEPAPHAPVTGDVAVLRASPLTRIQAACPPGEVPRAA